MTSGTIQFDFRNRPISGKISRRLESWIADFNDLIQDDWNAMTSGKLEYRFETATVAAYSVVRTSLSIRSIGVLVETGIAAQKGLMILPFPGAVQLCRAVLHDPASTDNDRPLTPLEAEVFGWVADRILVGMTRAWPGQTDMNFSRNTLVPHPGFSRIFAADSNLLQLKTAMQLNDFSFDIVWLFPEPRFSRSVLSKGTDAMEQPGQENRLGQRLDSNAIPIEIQVELECPEVPASRLEKLQAGDLIPLDPQALSGVSILAGGKRTFRGRITDRANRRALLITGEHVPAPAQGVEP